MNEKMIREIPKEVELHRAYSQGRQDMYDALKKHIEYLNTPITIQNTVEIIHSDMIEKMKCCGNCIHYRSFVGADICEIDKTIPFVVVQGDKKACENWEFGL